MKVKDVLRDLGPTTLVQIYKPVRNKYDTILYKAYTVSAILDPKNEVWLGKYFDKEIDRAEFEHHYTTNDMIASCNIYLKAEQTVNEEKQDTNTAIYADLKKKRDIFRKQAKIGDDFEVKVWLNSLFLHMLSNGELVEMEDKDLS